MTDIEAVKAMLKIGNSNKHIHFTALHNFDDKQAPHRNYLSMMMRITPDIYRWLVDESTRKRNANVEKRGF